MGETDWGLVNHLGNLTSHLGQLLSLLTSGEGKSSTGLSGWGYSGARSLVSGSVHTVEHNSVSDNLSNPADKLTV